MACLRSGGLAGTRTRDQRLKRPLLYRLSYQPGTARGTALHGRYPCGIGPARNAPAKSKAPGKLINQTGWRKGIFRRLPTTACRVHCRTFMKSPVLLVASLAVLLAGCSTSKQTQLAAQQTPYDKPLTSPGAKFGCAAAGGTAHGAG